MPAIPASIEAIFVRAGWQPRPAKAPDALSEPSALVQLIIAEFGSLHVGKTGAGQELAASDVHFFASPDASIDQVADNWTKGLGRLVAFATAHNEHMFLYAGPGAKIYAFTDPDGKLYKVGSSFGEAMERLLLGLSYGHAIPGDA
jgi:hypothetical protein